MHQPRCALERHRPGRGAPAAIQKRGNTAHAVSALFDFRAVRIEDAIEGGGTGLPRLLQHQRLIEAYAGVARRQAPPELPRWQKRAGGRVEYDEVVAEAMHLREIDAHGGEEYLNPIKVPRDELAYRIGR